MAEGVFSGRFKLGVTEAVDAKHYYYAGGSNGDGDFCSSPNSVIPPVPFVRRDSSFGRAAATVVFDSCSEPASLLRNMSLLSSDISADVIESISETCTTQSQGCSYYDVNWCTSDNVGLGDCIEDFQPCDQPFPL